MPTKYAKKTHRPSSPGYILRNYFIKATGKTLKKIAEELQLPYTTLHAILNGRIKITPHYAKIFEAHFEMPAESWLAMQNRFDLYAINARRPQRQA